MTELKTCLDWILKFSGHVGETTKDPEAGGNPPAKKEKSGSEPIIIPIVLKMADFDHEVRPDFFFLC